MLQTERTFVDYVRQGAQHVWENRNAKSDQNLNDQMALIFFTLLSLVAVLATVVGNLPEENAFSAEETLIGTLVAVAAACGLVAKLCWIGYREGQALEKSLMEVTHREDD